MMLTSLRLCVLVRFCVFTHLQKALKEKTEHVDQLLQERDLERSELARTSAQAENVSSPNCL